MSQIAVLSDIHGNVWALQAVLADAKRKGVTTFLHLGDMVYGPIAPGATYELLHHEVCITIRGNQDTQIIDATERDMTKNPTMAFVREELGPNALTWLASLPCDAVVEQEIYLCHGTPTDECTYLLEDVSQGTAHLRPDADILHLLNEREEPVILCGHSHIPRVVTLSTGQLIVNPGSVGLPAYADDAPVFHTMENYHPYASYAVLERGNTGWKIALIKIPYHWEQAVAAARTRKREEWAYALSTGRVTR